MRIPVTRTATAPAPTGGMIGQAAISPAIAARPLSPVVGAAPAASEPMSETNAAACTSVLPPPGRQGLFRRFLNRYREANAGHHYLTGVATAASVYIVGDTVAQAIMPGKELTLSSAHIAGMVGMSLYYGWESPTIFRVIDRTFPLEKNEPATDAHQAPLAEGAALMTHGHGIGGILGRMGSCLWRGCGALGRAVTQRKQKIMRAAAYRIPIAPFWTMRHAGVMGLMHGSNATPTEMATASLALWATWLPLLSIEEYIVQNKVPLEYRFLAVSAVCFVWQISASLIALMKF